MSTPAFRACARLLLACWLASGLVLPAEAGAAEFVEVRPDVRYDAGTRLGMTAIGMSFEIPAGWLGHLPAGSEFLMLGSHTEPGVVLVTGQRVGLEEARAFFAQPIPLDATTIAQPAGAPTVEGQRLRQSYTVQTPQGTMFGHALAQLGDRGGVAFLAFGPDAAKAKSLAERLVASVKTHALQAPSGPLAAALAGRQLLYLRTSGGFSDEERIHLCSDGRALIGTNTTGVSTGGVGVGTYVGNSESEATWTVQGDQVLVIAPDGGTRSWPVSLRGDGSVGVGMDNWWVRPQQVCP